MDCQNAAGNDIVAAMNCIQGYVDQTAKDNSSIAEKMMSMEQY